MQERRSEMEKEETRTHRQSRHNAQGSSLWRRSTLALFKHVLPSRKDRSMDDGWRSGARTETRWGGKGISLLAMPPAIVFISRYFSCLFSSRGENETTSGVFASDGPSHVRILARAIPESLVSWLSALLIIEFLHYLLPLSSMFFSFSFLVCI